MAKLRLLSEFWFFLRKRKLLWMTPIILILLLLALFIYVTESSAVLPFIYALF